MEKNKTFLRDKILTIVFFIIGSSLLLISMFLFLGGNSTERWEKYRYQIIDGVMTYKVDNQMYEVEWLKFGDYFHSYCDPVYALHSLARHKSECANQYGKQMVFVNPKDPGNSVLFSGPYWELILLCGILGVIIVFVPKIKVFIISITLKQGKLPTTDDWKGG